MGDPAGAGPRWFFLPYTGFPHNVVFGGMCTYRRAWLTGSHLHLHKDMHT